MAIIPLPILAQRILSAIEVGRSCPYPRNPIAVEFYVALGGEYSLPRDWRDIKSWKEWVARSNQFVYSITVDKRLVCVECGKLFSPKNCRAICYHPAEGDDEILARAVENLSLEEAQL